MRIKELIKKYFDVFLYAFFGVCTTMINIVCYWFCAHIMVFNIMASTIVSWFISVLFAYVTNKKYVFHSKIKTCNGIVKELLSFFSCRLLTGSLDLVNMYVFVELLKLNDMFIKICSNIIIVLLNYIISKLIVFKKEEVR